MRDFPISISDISFGTSRNICAVEEVEIKPGLTTDHEKSNWCLAIVNKVAYRKCSFQHLKNVINYTSEARINYHCQRQRFKTSAGTKKKEPNSLPHTANWSISTSWGAYIVIRLKGVKNWHDTFLRDHIWPICRHCPVFFKLAPEAKKITRGEGAKNDYSLLWAIDHSRWHPVVLTNKNALFKSETW